MIATIHHSASDNPEHDNIETIRRWHTQRQFNDVGYSFFIRTDGSLELGRPYWITGAHVLGRNKGNIGICLSGNGKFKEAQFETLEKLLKMLKRARILDGYDAIYPHSHFAKTECPGFDVEKFKRQYLIEEDEG
jgi:N-acetylmuramoyl-L-alanine amidase